MFLLRARHQRAAEVEATESVIDQGDQLLKALVLHTRLYCTTNQSPEQWRTFSSMVDRILAVRKDIQSISIRSGDLTLFHRQADSTLFPEQSLDNDLLQNPTIMSRETIVVGGQPEPVFVFSRKTSQDPNDNIILESTFKQSAVTEKQAIALRMVNSLFNFSLTLLISAFLLSAAILIVALARDRKREELARQEEHLAFSGVMANGILHDFRNPMSAVRLDAQMLEREIAREDGFREQRVVELSRRISRAMGRMDKVFTEFLYMANPADEVPGKLDLSRAVTECVEILTPRLEQAGISVQTEIPADLPSPRGQLFVFKRALLNVLMNAIQFSPPEGRILITAGSVGNRVLLEISDQGPGIPLKQRREIFKLFVTGRPEGTGLGLFLAKTAIQRCDGEISVVDSDKTSGATFRLSLPAAESSAVRECVSAGVLA
ncbi:MAG: HAMP domain-containing sensor histidine kinase [Kiritimatiellae bacterium]|nr:HAMP domain-containing sensor histidine kinase [Kiritimatiellia bacterium]